MPIRNLFSILAELLSILNRHMAGGVVEEQIRDQVRALRARRGWTQKDFAARLREQLPPDRKTWGRQSNVSKYESGGMGADIDTLIAIAKTFKVPLSTFWSGFGGAVTDPEPEIADALKDPEKRPQILHFVRLPAGVRATVMLIEIEKPHQQQESASESHPAGQAASDETPGKRGRTRRGGGGKP